MEMYYVINPFGHIEFSGTLQECREFDSESSHVGREIVPESNLGRFVDDDEENTLYYHEGYLVSEPWDV